MLCEKCQKNQATIHMQQIVNGAKIEIHLCPACSLALAELPVSFENLFQGVLDSILSMAGGTGKIDAAGGINGGAKAIVPKIKCDSCGMTYERFKTGGKLGCADCYRAYSHELETLFKNVQGSVRHEGKFPKRSGVEMRQIREADRLRVLLKKAVEDENFEEAAELRDRIRAMQLSESGTGEAK
jgi:protein arginine kinase activator